MKPYTVFLELPIEPTAKLDEADKDLLLAAEVLFDEMVPTLRRLAEEMLDKAKSADWDFSKLDDSERFWVRAVTLSVRARQNELKAMLKPKDAD
jgi:hypothetical protein